MAASAGAVESRPTRQLSHPGACPEHGADWLVRVHHQERLLADGRKLRPLLDAAPVLAGVTFDRPASNGRPTRTVHQQIKAERVTLKAPLRPDRLLPDVSVSVLLATEIDPPPGEDPRDWMLLTNLPVQTPEQALEKLSWYLCRWQLEVYFKVLESGCRVEQLQLETRERLESALGFYMVIAWRVLFLTMLGRDCPEMPCDTVFADEEWKAVYRFGVTNGWLFANPGLQGYRASVGHQPDADVTLVIFVTRKREADAESRQDMALFQSLAELLAPDNPPALSIR